MPIKRVEKIKADTQYINFSELRKEILELNKATGEDINVTRTPGKRKGSINFVTDPEKPFSEIGEKIRLQYLNCVTNHIRVNQNKADNALLKPEKVKARKASKALIVYNKYLENINDLIVNDQQKELFAYIKSIVKDNKDLLDMAIGLFNIECNIIGLEGFIAINELSNKQKCLFIKVVRQIVVERCVGL